MRKSPAPILATLLLATTVAAQGAWLKQSPTMTPPARAMAGLAAMTQQNKCVLFGGEIAESAASLNDTWTWDGTDWTLLTAPGPVPLEGFVMEYDLLRDRVVLFSGWTGGAYPADTWEFDGAAWTQVAIGTSPPGRDWSAGAYDPIRANMVIFGGHDWQAVGGSVGDTWTWDGATWTSHAVTGPGARWGHAMAFDPVRSSVILFGGGATGDDMWEWDGTTWSQITPTTVPPARRWHRMTTDPTRNRVVMTGGHWGASAVNDVWEWDGTDWLQSTTIGTPPSGSFLHCAALDPVTGQVLHFGGSTIENPVRTESGNDTKLWVPDATGYAIEEEFGTGCGAAPITTADSFYEQFPSGPHDLSGTSISMINTGVGYLALQGTATLRGPGAGVQLTLADDNEALHTLANPLTIIGGVTNELMIASNGIVSVADGGPTTYTPNLNTMLTSPVTGWYTWTDLSPNLAGSGQVYVEETATHAYVIYDGVYHYGTATPYYFELHFELASGNVDMVFGPNTYTNQILIGYSTGGASDDPGATDLSDPLAYPIIIDTTPPPMDLVFAADGRPVMGTTLDLTTSAVPPSSLLVGVMFGLSGLNPGFNLAPFGMPDCFQYTSMNAVGIIVPGGATSVSYPFAVPNVPAAAGVHFFVQSAAYDPTGGHNALGAVSSNGVDLTLDLN